MASSARVSSTETADTLTLDVLMAKLNTMEAVLKARPTVPKVHFSATSSGNLLRPTLRCYACNMEGHMARYCPNVPDPYQRPTSPGNAQAGPFGQGRQN